MPAYPFVPKSNRYLEAGQFWALPLSDGRYGCGRVMAVPAFGAKDRVGFVAGLAGWIGSEPPTEAAIAGAPVLLQTKAHFETISKDRRIGSRHPTLGTGRTGSDRPA
jgi:hypothetical protein